jgi:hypothetical protein
MILGSYGCGSCDPAAVAHNYGIETLIVKVVIILPSALRSLL